MKPVSVSSKIKIGLSLNIMAIDRENITIINPIISIEQKVKINLLSLYLDNKKQITNEGNDSVRADAALSPTPLVTKII